MRLRVGFCSSIRDEYHEDLERLLFFNPQQERAIKGIHHSIHEFGVPSIETAEGKLRISLQAFPDAQTLFALEDRGDKPRLVGVMVYARIDPRTIAMLHIAVQSDYSQAGDRADANLVARFVFQLREIGRKIKGIETIDLKYAPGLTLSVRKPAGKP